MISIMTNKIKSKNAALSPENIINKEESVNVNIENTL